jgi:glycosyltransferase involved in cell wall biosynthesis
MKTIKVLHVFKAYYPDSLGGVESVIYQLCVNQSESIESSVFTLSKNTGSVRVANHFVHRAKLNLNIASTGFSWSGIKLFKQYAAQADIIHYHFPWPFMDMLDFMMVNKKPAIVTYHSDIIKQKNLIKLYRPLMNLFLNRVDAIVATSPEYVLSSEVLQKFKHKTTVIPIGIDAGAYPKPSAELLSQWAAKLPNKFFIFVGVLRYYKGLHYLLDALKYQPYPLVIVGAGPEEASLKQQVQILGLKNVIFLGALSEADKMAVLQLAYAFVFPSHLRSEAFGVSLLEAAMLGKPMISCDISTGTTYVNKDQETGLVCQPENPLALSQAMTRLWENPEQTQAMGFRAQQRQQELFTSKQAAMRYEQLYRSILAAANVE